MSPAVNSYHKVGDSNLQLKETCTWKQTMQVTRQNDISNDKTVKQDKEMELLTKTPGF